MTYHTLWVARDLDGALRVYDTEPVWGETMWFKPPAIVGNPLPPNTTTWVRKMPPRWFPELKPGEKVRCHLQPMHPPQDNTGP